MTRLLAAAAVLLLSNPRARADDIAPPPSDCPPGAVGASSHLGEWCRPATCTTNADCAAGQTCRPGALCVEHETGTLGAHQQNAPYTRDVVRGPDCNACAAPAHCLSGNLCNGVPSAGQPPMDHVITHGVEDHQPAPTSQATGADDGGCSTAPRATSALALLSVALVAVAAAARRRPRYGGGPTRSRE